MTTANPVKRNLPAAQRRAMLLDAASELIIEHGVTGTCIDDVAAHAGVSKGAVYHHFKSKDDLLCALEQRFSTSIRDKARLARTSTVGLDDALSSWTTALVNAYLDERPLHDALFYGWSPTSRQAEKPPPTTSSSTTSGNYCSTPGPMMTLQPPTWQQGMPWPALRLQSTVRFSPIAPNPAIPSSHLQLPVLALLPLCQSLQQTAPTIRTER
ncbi:TetR/AcrR family transcriptional regulator [Mycolicibacterium komossense]|uniref:TetR/AcrR family transcriptional regulator n=1 Tax=Mycolicibacterium komossense TaxID=1779 RepID=A0ABT3CF17_9MYCO|nr:TetR/AcrR family transcriptional regulator [Mycolicibacterium komossense]MCV7228065.1 TetR/AcrR family transcriptional regulator [Mycolicibacterium komossense]